MLCCIVSNSSVDSFYYFRLNAFQKISSSIHNSFLPLVKPFISKKMRRTNTNLFLDLELPVMLSYMLRLAAHG